MTTMTDGAPRADQAARAEAALAQYPHLDAQTLDELVRWFRKEASALDVGMIASNPELDAQYQQFKRDHLGKFGAADLVPAAVIAGVAAGAIALIIWSVL